MLETDSRSRSAIAHAIKRVRADLSTSIQSSGLGAVFVNAGSLVGTTVVTGGLGIVYWWVAARFFTAADVGGASAAIAATILLAAVGLVGIGTLLIGELARSSPLERCRLVATALCVSLIVGGALGVGFAIAAPYVSSDLSLLGSGPWAVVLFGVTVSLMAAGLVVDNALLGMLRGDVQLSRNVLASVVKLGALIGVTRLPLPNGALAIYLSLFVGTLVSFVSVVHMAGFGRFSPRSYLPQWTLLRRLGRVALEHHALNLSLQVPSLVLPLLVTVLLSPTVNAYFYIASMFASLVYLVPTALSTVLYAAGAREPATFARKIRLTLGLSIAMGIVANLLLLVAAEPLLALFGRAYAQEVVSVLRLLVLGVFPGALKTHFVAICQTHRLVRPAAVLTAGGAVLELVAAALGARLGGLEGFTLGYVAALCVEAVIVAPVVYSALMPDRTSKASRRWQVVRVALHSHFD